MKRYLLFAVAALLLAGYSSSAQDLKEENEKSNDSRKQAEADSKEARKNHRESEKNRKLKEYDEIIIKRKDSDKDKKVVIEIKDDEVIVNGQPIDQYIDDEVSVRLQNANRYSLDLAASPFRMEGVWNSGKDVGFLGVMTEGSAGGAKVINVSENSAAAAAGLKKDDLITKLNGKEVYDHEQITEIIGALEPDEKVTITYKRDGKENTTTAKLGRRSKTRTMYGGPDAPIPPIPPMPPLPPLPPMEFNFDNDLGKAFHFRGEKPRLGIKAQDTEDGKGVKVLDVDEGSAAQKAGIREDDIITSFEGKEVNSAEELSKASREAREKTSMKVQLSRKGKSQIVELKLPKKLRTAEL